MDALFNINRQKDFNSSKKLIIGSYIITMHFQNENSRDIFSRPFSHLAGEFEKKVYPQEGTRESPDLEIFVIHDEEGKDPIPAWKKFEDDSSEDKKLIVYNKDGKHLLYNHESKVLTGYDKNTKKAYYYIPRLDMLPYYEKAAPMRMIFHHFCEENFMTLVHGASVSINGKGILLIGSGGSGKTTTAISAVLNGFEYLGDDYVILNPKDRSIFSIYSSSKIRWESGKIVTGLENLAINSKDEDKGYFFMEDQGKKIRKRSTLGAVVIPRIGQGETTYSRIPAAKALLILSASTIFQMPGSGNRTLKDISKILKDVPVFEMVLGRDTEKTNNKLEEIIKGL